MICASKFWRASIRSKSTPNKSLALGLQPERNGQAVYFALLAGGGVVSPGLVGVADGSLVAFVAPVPVGSVFDGSCRSVLLVLPQAVMLTNATIDAVPHIHEFLIIRNLP